MREKLYNGIKYNLGKKQPGNQTLTLQSWSNNHSSSDSSMVVSSLINYLQSSKNCTLVLRSRSWKVLGLDQDLYRAKRLQPLQRFTVTKLPSQSISIPQTHSYNTGKFLHLYTIADNLLYLFIYLDRFIEKCTNNKNSPLQVTC